MKGIILAGGKGTRLGELSRVVNKHLLPIGDCPMVYHPIKKLVDVNIKDIMIVSGCEKTGDFIELLGSGRRHGCRLTYRVQEDASGIANALAVTEGFCHNEKCVVLLGDNIFEDSLSSIIESSQEESACIAIKEVEDPNRYGVPCFCGNEIVSLVEKPSDPPSKYAVTGIYIYPPDVYDVIRTLEPSSRGEYEITDVNNYYIRNKRMNWTELNGYWTDAGTLDSWYLANQLVRERTL